MRQLQQLTQLPDVCLQKLNWQEHPNQELVQAWIKHFQGAVPPEDGPVPAPYALVWEHFGGSISEADRERITQAADVQDAETLEVRL